MSMVAGQCHFERVPDMFDLRGMKATAIGLLRGTEPTESTNHANELEKVQSGDDGMPDAD